MTTKTKLKHKHTTLNKIRDYSPPVELWVKLLTHLDKYNGDDDPLPFATIVQSNGLDDALWCCRSAPEYDREWRLYAVWCVRQVQHLLTDSRSIAALDVAERYAYGDATADELDAASDAVRAAAYDAARAAAWAAVSDDASDAAKDAAWAAAWAAGWATGNAAGDAVRAAQEQKFLEIVGGENP